MSEAQFGAGRHYQALHEIAFAGPLGSVDLTMPVIDKSRYGVEPFSDQQRDAIQRLRVIDGTLALPRRHATALAGTPMRGATPQPASLGRCRL